jgi:adenine phosphoribosyltransferase
MTAQELRSLIREVADFPKPGINFFDITTLLLDPEGLRGAVEALASPFRGEQVDAVIGVESRGFILGAPVALALGCGFIPVRKPGKLPAATVREEYELEYGTDAVEIHRDAIGVGQRVLLIDDLLATGGTMAATCQLVERLDANVCGIGFLIELCFLNGRAQLGERRVEAIIQCE